MLRLQCVQNTAARLICRIKKFEHILTSLQSLHWLPVASRPRFKLLCIVFRAFHGVGPRYLQELICPYRPTCSLRSESKNLLYVPACRTATYGNRLFTVETAILWNDLPQEVEDAENLSSFKRLLKTHFFNTAFLKIYVQCSQCIWTYFRICLRVNFAISLFSALERHVGFRPFINAWIIIIIIIIKEIFVIDLWRWVTKMFQNDFPHQTYVLGTCF